MVEQDLFFVRFFLLPDLGVNFALTVRFVFPLLNLSIAVVFYSRQTKMDDLGIHEDNRWVGRMVLVVYGPTGAGKTDLAFMLSRRIPSSIIHMDSASVYKGMDIGTAKPARGLLLEGDNYVIDMVLPEQSFSVADFCRHSLSAVRQSRTKKKLPIIVGGSSLYLYALLHGMAPLPGSSDRLRAMFRNSQADMGCGFLHDCLRIIDFMSTQTIQPNDSQRTMRALEASMRACRPMSEQLRACTCGPSNSDILGTVVKVALCYRNRDLLLDRLTKRFDDFLQRGMVKEVISLIMGGQGKSHFGAMKSVGYRQVREFLTGGKTYAQMRSRALTANRRLVKKQMTWLRKISYDYCFMADECSLEKISDRLLSYLPDLAAGKRI